MTFTFSSGIPPPSVEMMNALLPQSCFISADVSDMTTVDFANFPNIDAYLASLPCKGFANRSNIKVPMPNGGRSPGHMVRDMRRKSLLCVV